VAASRIASSSRLPCRLAGGELLERGTDGEDREQLRVVDGANSSAAERLGLDEPQQLQVSECLANRRLARSELARQPGLDETFSRLELPPQDSLEQDLLDLLAKDGP
jgi:hypothetical protein